MERQSIVQARIAQIRQRLSEVQSIDYRKFRPDGRIRFARRAVRSGQRGKITLPLVTSEESDSGKRFDFDCFGRSVSCDGREEGDEITSNPERNAHFEIYRLTTSTI
jgi:hypothetical protein